MTCSSRSELLPNASSPISSETVKPMPASMAMPMTSIQASSSSSSALVNFDSSHVDPVMPTVLPTSRPVTMPRATGSLRDSTRPLNPPTVTPAAKKAKIGTATPALIGRTRCSRCSARPGPSASSRRSTGTVKPRSTPATVAWTPDSWTSTHATSASGSSRKPELIRFWTSSAKIAIGTRPSARKSRSSSSV